MSAALEIDSVSVHAGPKVILDRISLQFWEGESTALVGPNGAGKSTLLRTLAGEIRPTCGEVRLKGKPLAAFSPRILAQHRAVLPHTIILGRRSDASK